MNLKQVEYLFDCHKHKQMIMCTFLILKHTHQVLGNQTSNREQSLNYTVTTRTRHKIYCRNSPLCTHARLQAWSPCKTWDRGTFCTTPRPSWRQHLPPSTRVHAANAHSSCVNTSCSGARSSIPGISRWCRWMVSVSYRQAAGSQ